MKGMESSMKLQVALGATQRKGQGGMAEEWIRAPKYVGRRTDPCLKGNGYRCISYMRNMGSEEKQISDRVNI